MSIYYGSNNAVVLVGQRPAYPRGIFAGAPDELEREPDETPRSAPEEADPDYRRDRREYDLHRS